MNIVRVRLRKPRRVLLFSCGELAVQREDTLIVETDQGLEWGTCLLPPEPCSPEMEKRITMRVVRKTTSADRDAFVAMEQEERKAKEVCQKRIDKRDLPMRLVDAEYTFDRHKVTFYFTADNRVDFRELVRDLARELHSRIELRHIQVRDRSKLVGGLGCCGRELCCASWLDGFAPISMRMAKCQNLSLNPGKISGQCGRLLCCLQYENEVYEKGDLRPSKAVPIPDDDVDDNQLGAIEEENPHGRRIVVEAPEARWESSFPVPSESGGSRGGDGKRNKKNKKKKRKPGQGQS